jgi:hypothetical protein
MRSLPLRWSVLLCSLSLVLPGGWCCMLKPFFVQRGVKRPVVLVVSCCCCCERPAENQPADDQDAPKPAPLPAGKCPCSGRYCTSPNGPTTIDADFSFAAPMIPPADQAALPGTPRIVSLDLPPPDPLLHLQLCVWLC